MVLGINHRNPSHKGSADDSWVLSANGRTCYTFYLGHNDVSPSAQGSFIMSGQPLRRPSSQFFPVSLLPWRRSLEEPALAGLEGVTGRASLFFLINRSHILKSCGVPFSITALFSLCGSRAQPMISLHSLSSDCRSQHAAALHMDLFTLKCLDRSCPPSGTGG